MSKQLAISSCFSVFAMACLTLLGTDDRSGMSGGDAFMPAEATLPSMDMPKAPNLLP